MALNAVDLSNETYSGNRE